ncbi:MAG: hypothetical protein ACREN6_13815 [Gemmatimonadaceae bacterium]
MRNIAVSPARRERVAAFAAFAVTAFVFLAILWPELGYVPIWDGRVYADCAIHAAATGLSMESLRCAAHPSQGYIAVLAASQLVWFGQIAAIHLTNAALGLLALASFRVVLGRVFPDPALARHLDLVTFICAVQPVLLSTLLQVNIDFGVYVFFFASLAALLSGRFAWAAAAGVFLCFSKETGVLAYAVMAGLDALLRALPGPRTISAFARRLGGVLRPMWTLALPVLLFGAHVLWWNATHKQGAVWKQAWQKGTIDGFKFFDLSDPIFVSYAAGIFVVGFMWVVTGVIGSDLAWGGVRMARRLPARAVPGADHSRLVYLGILTTVLTYLLTSYRTWSNLRYFALLYPLLVAMMFAAMLRLGIGRRARGAALVAVAALFVFAAYRSSDPISRLVYGTFSIGERDMYRMSSITQEYSGPGRDELVYNLQFTGYHHVQDALFQKLRPTDSTVFATARLARWNVWSPLDARTYARTLRGEHVIVPRYMDEVDVATASPRPHDVWFLDFSYRPYKDRSLAGLARLYRDIGVVNATADGHTLVAHHLQLISP